MRVMRAGWSVPAVAQPVWRYCQLVESYGGEGNIAHHPLALEFVVACSTPPKRLARRRRLVKAKPSSWKFAEAASPRATTTRSHPRATSKRRATSRSLRLIRLRTTAFPTLFPTVNPNRLTPSPLGSATRTSALVDQLLPLRLTSAKSCGLFKPWCLVIGLCERKLAARGLHRKSLASLEHAASENIATAAGAHSRSEAVDTAPTSFAWLVRSFWQNSTPVERLYSLAKSTVN